jgi:hypothetical protein
MTTVFRLAVLSLIGSIGGLPFAGSPLSAQSALDPTRRPRLALRVPKPPTVALTASGAVLVYELHVMNVSPQPWTILKVEVLSGASGTPLLHTLTPDAIESSIVRPGTNLTGSDRRLIGGAGWAVIYLFLPIDGTAPPVSSSIGWRSRRAARLARRSANSRAQRCRYSVRLSPSGHHCAADHGVRTTVPRMSQAIVA